MNLTRHIMNFIKFDRYDTQDSGHAENDESSSGQKKIQKWGAVGKRK